MKLEYACVEHWPPLAWLARCEASDGASRIVRVRHGAAVETGPGGFCEAVWDGDYAAGRFDRTDLVFGSGGRIAADGGMTFVASGAMVDRLHSWAGARGEVWISNSLVCLLAERKAGVDPRYPRYCEDFETVIRGLDRHKPELATSMGPVRLTYHHNLHWDGRRLRAVSKPHPRRDFRSFAHYRAFLDEAMARLAANLRDARRRRPYQMLGTLSAGYDAATAAALARPHGLREAISVTRTKDGKDDSGTGVAEALGIEQTLIDREGWRDPASSPAAVPPEAPFLAANAQGRDIFLRGAEPMLARRVLLTGAGGDNVWGMNSPYVGPDMRRGDMQGLSLCEYRLWAGFLHLPVPFLGIRQTRDVRAISRSPRMAAWDTGRYSRPICRRILEEAGVPREAFGMEKRAAAIKLSMLGSTGSILSPASERDYRAWLGSSWRRRGRVGRLGFPGPETRARLLSPLQRVARWAGYRLSHAAALPAAWRGGARGLVRFGCRSPLFPPLFPWAIERAAARYRRPDGAGTEDQRSAAAAGGPASST